MVTGLSESGQMEMTAARVSGSSALMTQTELNVNCRGCSVKQVRLKLFNQTSNNYISARQPHLATPSTFAHFLF